LYNEKLHNLYSSKNVISVIKSGRVRWTGQVARIWDIKNSCICVSLGGFGTGGG